MSLAYLIGNVSAIKQCEDTLRNFVVCNASGLPQYLHWQLYDSRLAHKVKVCTLPSDERDDIIVSKHYSCVYAFLPFFFWFQRKMFISFTTFV